MVNRSVAVVEDQPEALVVEAVVVVVVVVASGWLVVVEGRARAKELMIPL